MYHYLLSLSMLKSFTPYFRKHILTTLGSHDLLFINTFIISFVVFLFFLYKLIFDKSKTISETFKNYGKLSITQICCLVVMSLLAVGSSIFIFEFDKNYNTPLINSMLSRIISTLCLVFVGVFIFEEKYSWIQISGIILTIVGVFLISMNK